MKESVSTWFSPSSVVYSSFSEKEELSEITVRVGPSHSRNLYPDACDYHFTYHEAGRVFYVGFLTRPIFMTIDAS